MSSTVSIPLSHIGDGENFPNEETVRKTVEAARARFAAENVDAKTRERLEVSASALCSNRQGTVFWGYNVLYSAQVRAFQRERLDLYILYAETTGGDLLVRYGPLPAGERRRQRLLDRRPRDARGERSIRKRSGGLHVARLEPAPPHPADSVRAGRAGPQARNECRECSLRPHERSAALKGSK